MLRARECAPTPYSFAVLELTFEFIKELGIALCTFNQTKGYWLFIDALNVALSISVCMKIQTQQFNITPFNIMRVDFEFELGLLWVCMMAKVQVVLAPFIAFTSYYNVNKAHNMLALVLDPRFKFFNMVKMFVGQVKVIQMWLSMKTKFCCHYKWLLFISQTPPLMT